MMGPPGTGKTLLARAIAGEANVPFFFKSPGLTSSRCLSASEQAACAICLSKARRTLRALIFIDEIDAVGRHRGQVSEADTTSANRLEPAAG